MSKGLLDENHIEKLFNYQWSGGGLIRWQDPISCWNRELARRGKLHCPECGCKMRMYYDAYCPICRFKDGIKPLKGQNCISYYQMFHLIEAKYNVKLLHNDDHNDFYTFVADKYFGNIVNDTIVIINWADVYKRANEQWQKDLANLFVKEFGDKDYLVLISW